MPDVFISYSRENRDTARLFANALEAEGLSVWWDAALRAGEAYDEVTEQNLRQSGAVVVLWSKHSASSKWVRAEATVGERASTLVPALIEECERPIRFELVQTADLRHWRGDRADPQWRAFMQDIGTALSKRSRAPMQGQARAAAPIAPAATETSIETTFWNTLKDGNDRADFEAYLRRYPNGHFAALAQNRIAALSRAQTQSQSETRAQPQASAYRQPGQPGPTQQRPAQQSPAQQRPAQQRPTPRPPEPKKKSGAGPVLAGLAALVLIGGAAAFFMTRKDAPFKAAPAAASAPVATVAEKPDAQAGADGFAEGAPATDTLAASESGAAGDIAPMGEASVPSADELASLEAPSAAAVETAAAAPAESPAAAPVESPAPAVAGDTFRDCPTCPLMALIPGGSFSMGSPSDEAGRNPYEGPQRTVTIRPFAIGVYEVTGAEWAECVADGACAAKRRDDTGKLPVLGLTWREASSFAAWLTKKTGRTYRLPTEAEWEYAARAGSANAYWWGERFDASRVSRGAAGPVGQFAANAFGLYDVTGNAREWVADCYVNNFVKAPVDGSAVTDGDCSRRVVRGGYWASPPADMRVANRSRIDQSTGASYMGVRIAADSSK